MCDAMSRFAQTYEVSASLACSPLGLCLRPQLTPWRPDTRQMLNSGHVRRVTPVITLRRRLWLKEYIGERGPCSPSCSPSGGSVVPTFPPPAAGHETDVEAVLVAYQLNEQARQV